MLRSVLGYAAWPGVQRALHGLPPLLQALTRSHTAVPNPHPHQRSELPWGMDIHRDAWVEWAGLEARHRRRVLSLLLRLAGGRLGSDPRAGQVKRVRTEGGPDFEHIEVRPCASAR